MERSATRCHGALGSAAGTSRSVTESPPACSAKKGGGRSSKPVRADITQVLQRRYRRGCATNKPRESPKPNCPVRVRVKVTGKRGSDAKLGFLGKTGF